MIGRRRCSFFSFYCLPYGCLMNFKALAYLAVILHSLCWQLRVVKPSTTSQKTVDAAQPVIQQAILLYFFFFLLLFGLRAARLIKSNALFEWAITGFLFLFALLLITLTKRSRSWKQPLHLNVLTFIRGVIGNFLFFSARCMLPVDLEHKR